MAELKALKTFLEFESPEVAETGILELSNKPLGNDDSIVELIGFIRSNKPTQVYCDSCGITDTAIERLFSFLKTDTSIQLLSLRNNLISSTGLNTIVDSLRLNRSIKCIDLLRNPLEDTSAIINLLKTSKTLSSVCGLWSHYRELLVRSPLKTSDFELISADLRKNTHLVSSTLNLKTHSNQSISPQSLSQTLSRLPTSKGLSRATRLRKFRHSNIGSWRQHLSHCTQNYRFEYEHGICSFACVFVRSEFDYQVTQHREGGRSK